MSRTDKDDFTEIKGVNIKGWDKPESTPNPKEAPISDIKKCDRDAPKLSFWDKIGLFGKSILDYTLSKIRIFPVWFPYALLLIIAIVLYVVLK